MWESIRSECSHSMIITIENEPILEDLTSLNKDRHTLYILHILFEKSKLLELTALKSLQNDETSLEEFFTKNTSLFFFNGSLSLIGNCFSDI